MSSKSKPKNHKFYILGKHKRKNKRVHMNKYVKFSKAKPIKATPLHRRARNVAH